MIYKGKNKAAYAAAGVDSEEAKDGLANIAARIHQTWTKNGFGAVKLELDKFANVIDMGLGEGMAICTDGVGSKTIIAERMGVYDTIGIDCIAMNVNDMICVGAKPLSFVDYIAMEKLNARVIDEIMTGLCEGAETARISISGGETAQLSETVRGFDLVGTAVGIVTLDKILTGKGIEEGDVVIGINSNGIHCNGMSLARRAFFELGGLTISSRVEEFGCSIGEELLKPTHIYVKEVRSISEGVPEVKALINITGGGLFNLNRVDSDVGFVLDNLPEPPPVFHAIQELANVDSREMFEVFNMGVGFCIIVPECEVDDVLSILIDYERDGQRIGYAVKDPEKKIYLPLGLGE